MRKLFTFIQRFCYYGYHGAKNTYDFEALGIHYLIHAHIKRVSEFMHNPSNTHLEWSVDKNCRGMRQLRELVELSKRIATDDVGDNFNKLFEERVKTGQGLSFLLNGMDGFKKESLIAMRKDKMIKKGLEDRYWHLLRYKVPKFWD